MEYLRKLLGQNDPNAAEEFFANDRPMVREVDYTERPTEQADSELFERNVDRAINDPYAGSDMSPEVEAEATRRSQEMAGAAEAERVAFESQQSQPERTPAAEPPKSKEQMLLEEFQKMRKDSDERLKSAETMDAFGNLLNVISPMVENRRRAKAIQSAQSLGADPGSFMPKIATDNASRALAGRQAKINELMQEQKLMAALQPKTMSKLDASKIRESEAKAKMYEAKAEQAGKQPASVFEKKKMEKLAAAGVDYITKDRDQLTSNVDKINSALDLMKKAPSGDVSGPVRGLTPDVVRSFTNPEAITTREYMQSSIQETLRPILGAQFTETEGKKIMELAYNEKADPATNMTKATALKERIEQKVKFSDALYKYLEENGTDKGFPYEKYEMRKVSGADQSAQKDDTIRKKIINGQSVSFKKTSEGWKEIK
jgi:hypothetical protein